MFQPTTKIDIKLDSDMFMIGDTIVGSIDFHTSSITDITTIEVSLEGVLSLAAVRKKVKHRETKITHVSRRKDQKKSTIEYDGTDSDCEGTTTEEKIVVLNKTVQVYPFDTAGLGNPEPQQFEPGVYSYKFTIEVPEFSVGTKNSEWQNTRLPPSFTLPSKRGFLEYRITAVAHRPGRFSRATRGHMPMRLLEFSETPASGGVDRFRSDVNVEVFHDKQPTSRLLFGLMKSLGWEAEADLHPVSVELVSRSDGVPIGGSLTHLTDTTALKDYLLLVVYAPVSNTTLFVSHIKVVLQGDFVFKAKETSELYNVEYLVKDEKVGKPLVFNNGKADITDLLGESAISGNIVPTLSLPQVKTSYQLKVNITIGAGDPEAVITTTAKLAVHLLLRKPDRAGGLYRLTGTIGSNEEVSEKAPTQADLPQYDMFEIRPSIVYEKY